MGEVLKQIYEFVEKKGGLKARMQLVERTGIAKEKAGLIEEEEEIVRGFKALAAELTGQSFDDYLRSPK
ncbi:MAG: hypothetical protein A4E69_01519 [Syntrophus sp. PtaB.Bin138]|jgi:hypothetical protein|nr:MAG: hypothetical protein A4E69_01519 [Syntrophus sp. PtaB.Bin138]